VLAESGESLSHRARFPARCSYRDARYYPYQEHDEVPCHRSNSAGSPFHTQHTHAMKSICIECGHTHGHHHPHCPELPEIQQDEIEITVTSEAEDNFNQFDLIP